MIAYTTNQVLDLIIDAKCKDDVTAICDYLGSNAKKYCIVDLQIFKFFLELNIIAYK